MRFLKRYNLAIASLLTLFTLTNVIGCSQESPQAKTTPNTTIAAITASPVADNNTVQNTKRTFTPEIVKAYIEGCQASGGTKAYCNCFIGKIKVSFSPDEFDKAGETFKSKGKIPDAIAKSMKACEPAPVPTPKPTNSPINQPQSVSANTPATDNAERELALHLKKIGAVMYGTYWCPYCNKQKQVFGDAISEIQYIECDPRGNDPHPELCDSFGVSGYPTWQINGRSYSGSYALKDIATISGYQGSRNFKY
jgi:glutaredoxin